MITTANTILLEPCPSSPNCVSSQNKGGQFVEPLSLLVEAPQSLAHLLEILESRSDTTIIAADHQMIRVEFKTSLGFVDDGHFVLDSEHGIIQVLSASRVGYWDFGKNRRRLEEIRRQYTAR